MSSDQIAQLTLAGYALAAVACVAWQAVRCDHGPIVWCLYCVQRAYSGLWFHWRSNGHCPFPASGPGLIYANHRSPVDPLMLWTNSHLTADRRTIRVIGFMMASEFANVRGLQWLFRAMQVIPVERRGRDVGPAREALRRLKQGRLVGLFPEGGINRGPTLRAAGSGLAWLAISARVPVFPVFIHDSPGGRSMVEPFLKGGHVRVTYGQPLDLSPWYDVKKSPETLQEVTDLLMQHLAELGGVSYARPPQHTAESPATLPFGRATG